MADPLESSFLKLGRAVEHLEQTEAEIRRFVDTGPYVPVITCDEKTMKGSVNVRVLGEPPLRLGLLAGDVLHEVRGSLDHLIYQLAGLDPDQSRGEKTQYPIFDKPEIFDANFMPYLKGVPAKYWADIREAQPYNERFAMLGPLARLNDRDKHRIIDPIASSAASLTLVATPPAGIYDIRAPEDVVYFDDGAELASFKMRGKVDVEARDFAYFIRFGPRGVIGIDPVGMRLLIARASEILGRFRAAFD